MKLLLNYQIRGRRMFSLMAGLLISLYMYPQTWPTATELASQMTIGWNLGNSLEVPGDETAWGNPATTQTLIDGVKAAGFNTVRIPCAWDSYANQSTQEISALWLARVKEVVDYCMVNNMYIIINIHWDGGWLEENCTQAKQSSVNAKQSAYWTQIATYFKDYDHHLLFASANEPNVSTANEMAVLLSYHQTFIDVVRSTGGNNSSRVLIVQGPSTDIEKTNQLMTTMPTDPTPDRVMAEIHYYTPWNFCGLTQDESWGNMFYYWGQGYHSTTDPGRNPTWGEEDAVESYFQLMKTQFVDNGIPVIMGEYGAIKRTSLTGDDLALHIAAREYYFRYVTDAAIRYGLIPIYWDNGYSGNNGFALFDRNTGAVTDQGAVDALMEGAGSSTATYTLTTSTSGPGSVSLSPSGGSYASGTVVTLTANAGSGYQFLGWSGDLSGSTNPATISMNSNKSVTATFVEQGTIGTGTILREYWTGISGTSISNLTSNVNYPNNPSGSGEITSLEGPVDWADNYGTRIRGYLHPPATGTYTLWLAGDDYTDLYLSTDDNPANASRIAYVSGWTNSREWNKYSTQTATVNLTAGNKYYIEVLHKEGSGGDNVAVAWQGPGISQAVISGAYLSPYAGTSTPNQYTLSTAVNGSGSISLNPAGGTYDAGTVVTVTANANASWQFDNWSGDLGGTTNPTSITMDANKSITANFSSTPTGNLCDNPIAVTAPFSQDGEGEYCWAVSGGVSYVNSWNMDILQINGIDYTNIWSNQLPAKIKGVYQIYYKASLAWAHFEISKTKSADEIENTRNTIGLFPNPFTETINLDIENPGSVNQVLITDQLGRVVQFIEKSGITENMQIGQNLDKGVYIVRVTDNKGTQAFIINKGL